MGISSTDAAVALDDASRVSTTSDAGADGEEEEEEIGFGVGVRSTRRRFVWAVLSASTSSPSLSCLLRTDDLTASVAGEEDDWVTVLGDEPGPCSGAGVGVRASAVGAGTGTDVREDGSGGGVDDGGAGGARSTTASGDDVVVVGEEFWAAAPPHVHFSRSR